MSFGNKDRALRAYVAVNILQKLVDVLANSVLTICLVAKGMSFITIGFLWSLYLVSVFAFDFPSGAIADIIGRRKTYVFGLITSAISYLLISWGNSTALLFIAYVIKGVGTALLSGSLQAWLGAYTDASLFQHRIGKVKLYEVALIGPTVIAIGLVNIKQGESLLLIVAFIQIIAAIIATVFIPDNKGKVNSVFALSLSGLKDVIRNRYLLMGVMGSICSYISFTTYNLIWQPYANETGIDVCYFPLISALSIFATSGIGYLLSKTKINGFRVLNIAMAITLSSYLIAWNFAYKKSQVIILMFILFYSVASGISQVSIACMVNENASINSKATIFSIISSLSSLSTVLFQPVAASWTQTGYEKAFFLTAIVIGGIWAVFNIQFLIFNKSRGGN